MTEVSEIVPNWMIFWKSSNGGKECHIYCIKCYRIFWNIFKKRTLFSTKDPVWQNKLKQNILQKGRRLKIPVKNLQKVLICFEGAAANERAPGGMVRSSLAKYSKYFLKFLQRFSNICKPSRANIEACVLQIPSLELEKVRLGEGTIIHKDILTTQQSKFVLTTHINILWPIENTNTCIQY